MFMFPTIKLNIERWKYNPTFELWVSNMGHFRNKSKADIAPRVDNHGYLKIKTGGSVGCWKAAHRVVMLTWCPTPEAEFLTVDHKDHNKRNNALSNLEWVSEAENLCRAKKDFLCETVEKPVVAKPAPKMQPQVAVKYPGIYVSSEKYNVPETYLPYNPNEPYNHVFCNFFDKYIGLVPDMNLKRAKQLVRKLVVGTNNQGNKKWCCFQFTVEPSNK